jgi:pimeloyl-ACP methyl ester carboxylesterase
VASRLFTALPELPPKTHSFSTLARHTCEVALDGRPPFTLSYVEAGAGPPLLLVHGLMTSAYSWRYIIEPLSKQYRVIALDLPGAGQSAAPSDLSQAPARMAEVLAAFIRALELERPYVVGNSLGGYVSLWLTLGQPELVSKLMVMHSPGFPELRLYALRAVLSLPGTAKLFAWYTRNHEQFALDNVHYRDESLKSREETREYSRWIAEPERRELFRRNLHETMNPWTMRTLPAAIAQARAAGKLPPLRLLWSREDPLVSPALGPRYQALLPEAELVGWSSAVTFSRSTRPRRRCARFFASAHEAAPAAVRGRYRSHDRGARLELRPPHRGRQRRVRREDRQLQVARRARRFTG